MANITIAVGVILIGLGLGGYFGTGTTSMTAMIPAFLGLPILLLGLLALKDSMRKHAMHLAVMIGLIGFVGGIVNGVRVVLKGPIEKPIAFAITCAMIVVCGLFVALCVRSFIQARKARSIKITT